MIYTVTVHASNYTVIYILGYRPALSAITVRSFVPIRFPLALMRHHQQRLTLCLTATVHTIQSIDLQYITQQLAHYHVSVHALDKGTFVSLKNML